MSGPPREHCQPHPPEEVYYVTATASHLDNKTRRYYAFREDPHHGIALVRRTFFFGEATRFTHEEACKHAVTFEDTNHYGGTDVEVIHQDVMEMIRVLES